MLLAFQIFLVWIEDVLLQFYDILQADLLGLNKSSFHVFPLKKKKITNETQILLYFN